MYCRQSLKPPVIFWFYCLTCDAFRRFFYFCCLFFKIIKAKYVLHGINTTHCIKPQFP